MHYVKVMSVCGLGSDNSDFQAILIYNKAINACFHTFHKLFHVQCCTAASCCMSLIIPVLFAVSHANLC
jgi:hypothetical protein